MKNKLFNNKVIITSLLFLSLIITLVILNRPKEEILGDSNNNSDLYKALGKNELIIGIDESFPPITFKDIDGAFKGIDIELALELEKRTGVKVVFKPIEWDIIIPSLLAKQVDIIWSGMGITEERKEKVDFVTYSKSPKGVAFVVNNSSIKSREDLKSKVIAVQAGSYQEDDLKNGKIIPVNSWKEIKSMSTLPEAIMDLRIGRVDAIICGQDSASYYIEKTLNESDKFSIVDVGYGIGESGIAIRKEDKEVRIEIEKVINEIIADGTASKITMKWLGIDKYVNY